MAKKKDELLTNFIPINRGFFEHRLWLEKRVFSRAEAWLYLLKEARFEDSRVLDGNIMVDVKRGQVYNSLRFYASVWGWGEKKVRLFMDLLESEMMLEKDTAKGTGQWLLTICNYDTYNAVASKKGTAKGNQKTHEGHSKGTNYNKENIDNKEILSKESIKKDVETSSCTLSEYDLFNNWIAKEAPFCANPKNFTNQITEAQLKSLKKDFGATVVANVILQIENRKDLRTKYVDLNRTVRNWAKKNNLEKNETATYQIKA